MRTATVSEVLADLPNIDPSRFKQPSAAELFPPGRATHAPRFLLLYGSLRERSYSRLVAEEAARLRRALGGETGCSTRPGCRWSTTPARTIPRSVSCMSWSGGPKA